MNADPIDKKLAAIEAWLQKEYVAIRTGQAAPALLDAIKIESYGVPTPLNQVGSIGIEDARTLRISPWDVSQISAIETAITEADLGVSVATDSAGVRVIFPELTADRRSQLTKLAKSKLEDARVSVRNVRDEEMKRLEAAEKAGDMSQDDLFAEKDDVQKAVDATNKALEVHYQSKESEISV